MIKRGHKRGFTVIELLVVIVIIAILASVITVMYNSAQQQARDSKIRDAADKVADAIQLFAANKGHFPKGGWGSTSAIGVGTECADGANGFFSTGYLCMVQDTLIASDYLPDSFGSDLPPNTYYGAANNNLSLMVYIYGGNKAMVYYSLEDPSTNDTNNFNDQLTRCGINPAGAVTQRDTWGMRNGICFDY